MNISQVAQQLQDHSNVDLQLIPCSHVPVTKEAYQETKAAFSEP
jgi:hypothetical protein